MNSDDVNGSDIVLFEVMKLLNDPCITRKVLRAVLMHKYNFSGTLIDQLVPAESGGVRDE